MKHPNHAIIFAAGSSTRLKPLTNSIPKTLLSIGKLTMLDRIILSLNSIGIKKITVVVGFAGDKVKEHINNNVINKLINNDIRFKFITNDNLDIGNIYSFWIAQEEMNETSIICNSDVVFHPRILELVTTHDDSVMVIDDIKTLGEEEMKVKVENNYIRDISKTLDPVEADGEYIGITKISPDAAKLILQKIKILLNEGRFPLYYEDGIRLAVQELDIISKCSSRMLPWIEIDTIEDLQEAQRNILPAIDKNLI